MGREVYEARSRFIEEVILIFLADLLRDVSQCREIGTLPPAKLRSKGFEAVRRVR
jgi:hypothetical protein